MSTAAVAFCLLLLACGLALLVAAAFDYDDLPRCAACATGGAFCLISFLDFAYRRRT